MSAAVHAADTDTAKIVVLEKEIDDLTARVNAAEGKISLLLNIIRVMTNVDLRP